RPRRTTLLLAALILRLLILITSRLIGRRQIRQHWRTPFPTCPKFLGTTRALTLCSLRSMDLPAHSARPATAILFTRRIPGRTASRRHPAAAARVGVQLAHRRRQVLLAGPARVMQSLHGKRLSVFPPTACGTFQTFHSLQRMARGVTTIRLVYRKEPAHAWALLIHGRASVELQFHRQLWRASRRSLINVWADRKV